MLEAAREDQGSGAFFSGEIHIAGALCQAVSFADDRHETELYIHEKILDHAGEHLGLLCILQAVVCAVTFGEVEELAANGSNAAEMDGAGAAAEDFGDRAGHFHPSHVRVRIHFCRRRSKEKVGAGCFCYLRVSVQGSRVGFIVFVWSELGGVYENGGNDEIIFTPCCLDQRSVAFVKRAHGGDQADGFPFGFALVYIGFQFFDAVNDVHRMTPFL